MALEFKGKSNDRNNYSRSSNIRNTTEKHQTDGMEMETVTGVDDDTLNCCFQVMEAVSKLDPEQSQVLWCMVTDFVAAKNGIPAREIINTLVPLVVDVNDLMGPFFYDRYPPAPASAVSGDTVNKADS